VRRGRDELLAVMANAATQTGWHDGVLVHPEDKTIYWQAHEHHQFTSKREQQIGRREVPYSVLAMARWRLVAMASRHGGNGARGQLRRCKAGQAGSGGAQERDEDNGVRN
jgi:hypothetical protein